MERRRTFQVFEAAGQAGPFDELPMLPDKFNVQLHLSRNDRPQPFFLVCDHDTLVAHLSGDATVEFKESSVLTFDLQPGDYVYVPAGTPHRIVATSESVQLRYKADQPRFEGVAWYCEGCGAELWRRDWKLADELPQEGYWRACTEFNDQPSRRTCRSCGSEHPAVDLNGIRWREIAADIRASQEPAA